MGAYGGGQLYGIAIPVLIAVAVIALRNSRPRRLRLEAMWIRPAIILGIVALSLVARPLPTDFLSIAVVTLGLVVGAGLGWLRGSLMRIDVHPETHDISAQASPVAMLFILALLGLRMFLRGEAMTTPVASLSFVAITDALLLLAGGMLTVANFEMWLRARRLLGEAQAAKASGGSTPIVS
jgi:hypothetical protein